MVFYGGLLYDGGMTKNRPNNAIDRRLSVAPMMDWTNQHCRFFHRLLAPDALLFTEMLTAEALLHGNIERLLGHNPAEYPLALQLGGSSPDRLAKATRIAAVHGFQEINLNVGCPSSRVQSGRFGACLMAEPNLVADCVIAMQAETDLPVTIKCRIGINDMDEEIGLNVFVDTLSAVGVRIFYLHARKAWLKGLSPKENRDTPPLNYARARRLALRRPDLMIHLNGGLVDATTIMTELSNFAGVMLGRAAYKTPMLLSDLNLSIFGRAGKTRLEAAMAMADYADMMEEIPLHAITRHMLGLYASRKGARYWRRMLGEKARQDRRGGTLIRETASVCEEISTSWAA